MTDSEDFHLTDSDCSLGQYPLQPVNVLKHLPAARALLCQQHTTYQLYSPRCLYIQPLTRITQLAMPKIEKANGKMTGHRLLSIQDASFQHSKIKEKIKQLYCKNQRACSQLLWDKFCEKELYFSRFQTGIKKNNFASNFMAIGGIALDPKRQKGAFPQIKSKGLPIVPKMTACSVLFDSHFESGNLLYVFKNTDETNSIETFDLVLQNDINTKGHNQWFYFKVMSTRKNQKIKLNIINLVKKESLFSYGLKPLVFSQKGYGQGLGWYRGGVKICYQQNDIKRQHINQPYYTLSFQYEFRQPYDSVLFAPSFPYTYTQLLHFLDSLLSNKQYQHCLSVKKLCQSAGGNAVNLVSISTGKITNREKKVIWILGRQHPVETTSSFMVQGIILYLLDLMGRESQKDSSFYDGYIFKIVPMVNPDGVIHGNSRAEITGIDSNRVWKKPSKALTPAVHHIKKHILNTREETSLILDLHSHSKKLGCFFYGNYNSSELVNHRVLPSEVCQKDPRFCFKNCRFRGGNDSSARRALYNELKIPNIFTVECSLLGYVKDKRICEFKVSDYHEMGVGILETYFTLEKKEAMGRQKVSSYPHEALDFCDAQSARSDSCVSEDEYNEVYKSMKIKRKLKQRKKSKMKSNAHIQSNKTNNLSEQRPKQLLGSSNKLKDQLRSETIVKERSIQKKGQRSCLIRVKQPFQDSNVNVREDNLSKLKGKVGAKNIRFTTKKKIGRTIKDDFSLQVGCLGNKMFNQKSLQVEEIKPQNHVSFKSVEQRMLMVVGSGVDEQKMVISKNDIAKQNQTISDVLPQFKANSTTKITDRIPRIKENQQRLKERLCKVQQRGVMLFRN